MSQTTMDEAVRASAPAKVLLFGEHAVVYGCPSIAVALTDLRLTVTIDRNEADNAAIELVFDDILDSSNTALQRRFDMAQLVAIITSHPHEAEYLPRPSESLLQRIDELLVNEQPEHAKSLRPSLFLCCAIGRSSQWVKDHHGSLRIRVSAGRFPIGAGLGSSAAFSVALAGALMGLDEGASTINHDIVNQFAFASETILHGSPSGVDNTVSTFGGALQFHKLPSPRYERIVADLSKFRFLIVNTRVPRSTMELVAGVRRRYEADPQQTQQAFDRIEAIIDDFTQLGASSALTEATLGDQMTRNQDILNGLGVGHESIDEVAKVCWTRGIWTKLTGAGGGGCTVSLVPHSLAEDDVAAVVKELEARGYQCFLSELGGRGLLIETS